MTFVVEVQVFVEADSAADARVVAARTIGDGPWTGSHGTVAGYELLDTAVRDAETGALASARH